MNSDTNVKKDNPVEGSAASVNMHINAGLLMPCIGPDHRVRGMLNGAAKKHLGERLVLDAELPMWSAAFFNLDQSQLFSNASVEQQDQILTICSQSIVEEALLIEKCGMAFGAKMSALAESVEERMFYNLMSAEEAIHYHQVRQFLPNNGVDVEPNAFHELLSSLIENGDRNSLVFVIQVVLEGWGLAHYKILADNCIDEKFSIELREILKDESRHHGTGVIFSKQRKFNASNLNYVVDVLVNFLQMIQLGSQSVLGAVDAVLGPLKDAQKQTLLKEIDSEIESAAKLETLRNLMLHNGGADVVSCLDNHHSFTPYSAENCL